MTASLHEAFSFGSSREIGLGWVHHPHPKDEREVIDGPYKIEIAGERFPALASLRPMLDPGNQRIRC